MSSFVVFRKNAGNEQRLTNFISKHTGNCEAHDIGGTSPYRLFIWAGQTSSTAFYEPMGGEDFIAVCGSFFYGQETGRVAARTFFRDFDRDRFNWSACTGSFALVLHKAGQLTVLNDGIGTWKLFTDTNRTFVSAGFLEAVLLMQAPRFDSHGVYEYAFTGYPIGRTTFVDGLEAVPPNHLVCSDGGGQLFEHLLPSPVARLERSRLPVREEAEAQACLLEDRFRAYGALADGDVISSISGGLDSRLMVQNFVRAGIRPDLFVYGPDTDPDVVSARAVADHLGLKLDHVDKAATPVEPPTAEALLFWFDCWREDGMLGYVRDLADRQRRGQLAPYMANGKCGEIYRHYFYYKVPERGVTLDALVPAVFARHMPRLVTKRFDPRAYIARIKSALMDLTGYEDKRISPYEFDLIYPLVRMSHEPARDISVNHRFSHALFPYFEASLCGPAATLTHEHRLYGRVQAAMIAARDEALAKVESAYEYDLIEGPGLAYRLKLDASYRRPLWVRPHVPSMKARLGKAAGLSGFLNGHEALLPDQDMPFMTPYFQISELRDMVTASRIATMELIGQTFAFAA